MSVASLSLELRRAAHVLGHDDDSFRGLVERIGPAPVVLIGEASHGTHEFYRERARLTRALIRHAGFQAVAVEGDWPDCWRVDRWVRGHDADATAGEALSGFTRFPAWMWRNADDALSIGVFGASTGGGAALVLAADHPDLIGAVVSRGGRPDLAGDKLGHVAAPTLLIVGGLDHQVILLNERALARLPDARLEIVPGATHLFEEPGALAQVARLAAAWFAGALKVRPLGHRAA